VVAGVTAQVAGQLALTYLPVMNRLFQTAPITGGAWLRILILALAANLLLAAGIAANVVYLAYDPPWVRSLGDLVTTGIGLAAAIRIWHVFPGRPSIGRSAA